MEDGALYVRRDRVLTVFDKIREKSKIISFIVRLQNTALFPALIALLAAISGLGNKDVYIPCMSAIVVLCAFAGLFSPDLKVFLVPMLVGYYSIGVDQTHKYALATFDTASIPFFAACIGILFVILIYRIVASGYLREMLIRRGLSFWGIIFVDVALIFGGALSPEWTFSSFLFGVAIAAMLTLSYMLAVVILAHSDDGIAYACKSLVCLGYLIMIQVFVTAYRSHLDGMLFELMPNGNYLINRSAFQLSWGLATIIGAAMIPAIIAAVYLMKNRRFPLISLLSAVVFMMTVICIDTRSAMLTGALALLFGFAFACITGRNKRFNRIAIASLVGAVGVGVGLFALFNFSAFSALIDEIFRFLRLEFDPDSSHSIISVFSGRIELWQEGWRDFLASPLFGRGFAFGAMTGDMVSTNPFSNMYHNVFLQFLASMGVLGVLMLLVHLRSFLELFFRYCSLNKIILLFIPASILLMSMVDNFFFYPNFIIVYTVFLAAVEIDLEHKRREKLDNLKPPRKNGKPRVVFTYVEAGKGHITPTKNVCESFTRKYGDRCEVVQSKFFTETGDPDMEMTEKLFASAVKNQNRSPVLSVLCKIGNLLAGNTFALYALLKLSNSGRKTNALAVKHVSELDADVIYTAHWSIPFYVNQLTEPHPYVVCFCPDVYSNGAFDVDCNNFLISTDEGYAQVRRARMYAGGNITQIPFPMRPEVEKYKGEDKKLLYREKYGIAPDAFVVALCDGGYGMARLEGTVKHLLRTDKKITVITLCGTNHELFLRLDALKDSCPKNVQLIPVDFTDRMLEYLACADVFAGKSGANAIAEPAALGVPIIVTKCITYIEKGIKKYYVRKLKGALYIPSCRFAARKILRFAENPSLLKPMRENLRNQKQKYDADASADLLWQRVCEIYGNTEK